MSEATRSQLFGATSQAKHHLCQKPCGLDVGVGPFGAYRGQRLIACGAWGKFGCISVVLGGFLDLCFSNTFNEKDIGLIQACFDCCFNRFWSYVLRREYGLIEFGQCELVDNSV